MEQLSKARIKLLHSLQHKKYRLKYDKFIVEGLKIIKELVAEHQNIVESVYISNPDYQSVLSFPDLELAITLITPEEMKGISQMVTPPGALAVCKIPSEVPLPEQISGKVLFYLDAIRDPGNMGTILRNADWFGMEYVILSPDCTDIYNHKVIQASMGSALRVKTCVMDADKLHTLGTPLYVCDAGGESIGHADPPREGIFVLGNESQGVSAALRKQAANVYAVSGAKSLGAESLNVASVSAIVGAWLQND